MNSDGENRALARQTPAGDGRGHLSTMDAADEAAFGAASAEVPQRRISPASLLRYRWSILFVAVAATALAWTGIWLVMVPTYTATAKIEVSPVVPRLVESKSDMVPMYESFRASQVDHIKGPEVAEKVLDDADVQRTRWYRGTPTGYLEKALDKLGLRSLGPAKDRLEAVLDVTAPRGTQHIFVTFKCPFPGESRLIVTKVVECYKTFADSRWSNEEKSIRAEREAKILRLEGEARAGRERIDELRRDIGTADTGELLTQRQLRIWETQYNIFRLETRLKSLGTTAPASNAVNAVSPGQPRFERDAEWQRRKAAVTQAESALKSTQKRYGDQHPRVKDLEDGVSIAKSELAAREEELRTAGPDLASGDVPEADRLDFELALAKAELERLESEQTDLLQKTAELEQRQNALEDFEKQLAELRHARSVDEMKSEVVGNIKTFLAQEPSSPDSDRRLKLMIAAPFGGLALAIGIAFLRVKLSQTVNAAEEAIVPVRGAFLGHVPWQPGMDATALQSSPLQVESVRMVRTAILQRLGPGSHIVQVSSPEPSSGKSTLSLMLGRSLAQCGKRVLLVDADVLRPSLGRVLGIRNSPGLMDVLADQPPPHDGVRETSIPRLSVLTSGEWSDQVELERLANGALSAFLERCRANFDIVLLDSSPLLGTANGAILSRQVDGTLLAVRERHCKRAALLAALAALSAAGGRLLGTVFVGSSGLSAYGYDHSYHYRRAETQAEESKSTVG